MILLSAGHHSAAKGAAFGEFNEHDEATKWAGQLAILLRQQTHVYVIPSGPLSSKIKFINDYVAEPVDLALEIHFNSDPLHKGRGSETLYCPGSVHGWRMAQIIQGALATIFQPNRGAKEGWYRQDKPGHIDYAGDVDGDEKMDAFLSQTKPPTLIVEPEFIHNQVRIESLRAAGCVVLCDAILEAVK